MQSTKQIKEAIDAAANEVRQIIAGCNQFDPPSEFERNRCDELCGQIENLKALLSKAERQEQNILAGSKYGGGNLIRGNKMQSNLTLPTNGQLPGDERIYPQHVPVASLRAFADAGSALDGGMWVKALLHRLQGTVDERAEEHCERRGISIANAMAESTGAGGGYITPAPVASTIIAVREKVGISRKVLSVFPTNADTLTLPKRVSGVTVYAPGEGNNITASDPSLGQIELIVKKRAAYTELTQELSDDSIINLADYIFLEFGHALALQEDKELVNGDGANTTYFGVRGLLNRLGAGGVSTAATGHDTWPELDMADMAACIGKLPDKYFEYGAGWIMSYSFFNAVCVRLAFAAGGATASEIMGGAGNVRSFMGYPVYLTSQMPTATAAATVCALFGSFSQAGALADRGPVRLARSDDYKFQEDKIALKATSRYDINIHDSGTASVAGAYVGLKTAS